MGVVKFYLRSKHTRVWNTIDCGKINTARLRSRAGGWLFYISLSYHIPPSPVAELGPLSAALSTLQGVASVAPYENDGDFYDEYGRPPHSIEIVVDGGDPLEIARQILDKKAGGINTYGDTTVVLTGAYDEDIPIRFSRPTTMYTWFHLGITLSTTESIPENYVDLLRAVVLENIHALDAGKDVIPQQFMTHLYKMCPGISYIDIKLFVTADSSATPHEYPLRSAVITARQRAYTTESMIEVAIDG